MENITKLANCGGCSAKLPPGKLKDALSAMPKFGDPRLLVGFDSSDDGAVYQLTDSLALIQTLDFFPPMVDDPYLFGKIAAANALSDVYAMGGDVISALNIVCFPEKGDMSILATILKGGAQKVLEAEGVLCGGHTINDENIKYGLSVTGTVLPHRLLKNNSCNIGDNIILTKPLGIGIIMSAFTVFGKKDEAYKKATDLMETLNKRAMEVAREFAITAATDVTGFGFLGHLNEMVASNYSIAVNAKDVSYIPKAYDYAKEFIITANAQKNRKYLAPYVDVQIKDDPLAEILYDPQTSGGLLISVSKDDTKELVNALIKNNVEAVVVAEVIDRLDANIIVR